jgi:hypothetical protein
LRYWWCCGRTKVGGFGLGRGCDLGQETFGLHSGGCGAGKNWYRAKFFAPAPLDPLIPWKTFVSHHLQYHFMFFFIKSFFKIQLENYHLLYLLKSNLTLESSSLGILLFLACFVKFICIISHANVLINVSGSCTPGTAGHQLQSKNLDTTDFHQQQMVGNHASRTGYGSTTPD